MSLPAGFQIHNGDLVMSLGNIPNGILPVHAYIPMRFDGVRMTPLEDPPVAYRNQMRAKRVADAERKRTKRRNPHYQAKYIIMGVTVK